MMMMMMFIPINGGIKKTATRHILPLPFETKARRGDGEYGRLYEALLKVRRTEVHLSVALASQ